MIAAAVATVLGTALSSVLSCLPGLHVYNVMSLLVMGAHALRAQGHALPAEVVVPFAIGLTVGYALLSNIPSVLLAAPDESALFTVLPGQKFLMAGRGYEGTLITAAGGLAGLCALVLIVGPLAPRLLPAAGMVFRPHTHWILWCVICFMLMSEWPKGGTRGQAGLRRFSDGWKTTGMGLLTFALSGLLGFLLFYRSPIPIEAAFQNIMPAFVGLFTLPWLLLNVVSRVEAPPQCVPAGSIGLDAMTLLRGTFAGCLGGGFAAFFPVITGGVGGLLAGHATATRDDRVFLVSQGASKLVYYVAGLLLLFVPGLGLTRGGAASMLKGLFVPRTVYDYLLALASVALAGATAFLLVGPLTRAVIGLMRRYTYRRMSAAALLAVLALVFGVTGCMGLAVMAVAGAIGMIPVLYGSRRMNCLGVILLPMACNMSGAGPTVARWLGLL